MKKFITWGTLSTRAFANALLQSRDEFVFMLVIGRLTIAWDTNKPTEED